MDARATGLRTVLVEAVRAAAKVCRAAQADLASLPSVLKPDESPVTVADLAAQAVVAGILARDGVGLPLAAEEDASPLAEPGRGALRETVLRWVRSALPAATEADVLRGLERGGHPGGASAFLTLDPIDGTKGFLRGGQFAVALALVEDGRPAIGVLGCPNLDAEDGRRGLVVHAARGAGCVASPLDATGADGAATRVSGEADPARARLCEPVETAHSDPGTSARVRELLGVVSEPLRMDSQAKYAALALGRAELYLRTPTREDRREWIWDHAAGALVVEEAGGRVTDADGVPLDFALGRRLERNRGIVATNGTIHDAVLGAIRRASARGGTLG